MLHFQHVTWGSLAELTWWKFKAKLKGGTVKRTKWPYTSCSAPAGSKQVPQTRTTAPLVHLLLSRLSIRSPKVPLASTYLHQAQLTNERTIKMADLHNGNVTKHTWYKSTCAANEHIPSRQVGKYQSSSWWPTQAPAPGGIRLCECLWDEAVSSVLCSAKISFCWPTV